MHPYLSILTNCYYYSIGEIDDNLDIVVLNDVFVGQLREEAEIIDEINGTPEPVLEEYLGKGLKEKAQRGKDQRFFYTKNFVQTQIYPTANLSLFRFFIWSTAIMICKCFRYVHTIKTLNQVPITKCKIKQWSKCDSRKKSAVFSTADFNKYLLDILWSAKPHQHKACLDYAESKRLRWRKQGMWT